MFRRWGVWGFFWKYHAESTNPLIIAPKTAVIQCKLGSRVFDSSTSRRPGILPPAGSAPQHLQQEIDVVIELRQRLAELRDLAAGVEDRRVVAAAEIAADFR